MHSSWLQYSPNAIKHSTITTIYSKKIYINPISFHSIIIKDTNFPQSNTHTHWKIEFSNFPSITHRYTHTRAQSKRISKICKGCKTHPIYFPSLLLLRISYLHIKQIISKYWTYSHHEIKFRCAEGFSSFFHFLFVGTPGEINDVVWFSFFLFNIRYCIRTSWGLLLFSSDFILLSMS